MRKIVFLVLTMMVLGLFLVDYEVDAIVGLPGEVKVDCIQEGAPCCLNQKYGSYCDNGLQCGDNGLCTNKIVEECGEVGQQCCPGESCNDDYRHHCVDGFCEIKQGGLAPGTFEIENLTDYPKDSKLKFGESDVGGIVSIIIQIVYWIAGLSMMAMIIIGGLQVMTSLGIPEKMKLGYGKMTGGVVGFLIIFSSYLIVKIVETIFGISILQ